MLNLNKLRAELAKTDSIQATDLDGNILGTDQSAAYFRGRAAADRAIELLKMEGVLPPQLEGMYEHSDVNFRKALEDIVADQGIDPK
jgi:hypothetical protein